MTTIDFDSIDIINDRVIARRKRRDRVVFWCEIGITAAAMLFATACLAMARDTNVIFGSPGYSISGPSGTTIVAPCCGSAAPHIIHRDAEPDPAAERRWLEWCKPTFKYDRLGAVHYVFAKPGCEFGISGDQP